MTRQSENPDTLCARDDLSRLAVKAERALREVINDRDSAERRLDEAVKALREAWPELDVLARTGRVSQSRSRHELVGRIRQFLEASQPERGAEGEAREILASVEAQLEQNERKIMTDMTVPAQHKRRMIAVDFDGVLHSYTSKWTNASEVLDPPIPGAIEWLEEISRYYSVVIFTTRAETQAGKLAVTDWLEKYGIDTYTRIYAITNLKPAGAIIFIDDRGWRFEGKFPTVYDIANAAIPWKVQTKT